MVWLFDRLIARTLIALWVRFSPRSWARLPVANDAPRVFARGADPDRILVAGGGPATGRGVITFDLALAGHLARRVSALTGRGVDLEAVVGAEMSAVLCTQTLEGVDLARFDAVVLSVGAVEALAFRRTRSWVRDLNALLDHVEQKVSVSTPVFVLSVARYAPHRQFPRMLAQAADRRVSAINTATADVVARHASVEFVPIEQTYSLEAAGASRYAEYAASAAPHISAALAPPGGGAARAHSPRTVPPRGPVTDRRSVSAPGLTGPLDAATVDTLSAFALRAREVFGGGAAVITVIRDGRLEAASTSITRIPEAEGGCLPDMAEITAIVESHAVAYSTLAMQDSRPYVVGSAETGATRTFALERQVVGPAHVAPMVQFVAVYPFESVDGDRIGAFCLLDIVPVRFTEDDAALLRSLALETQRHLWGHSAQHRREPPD